MSITGGMDVRRLRYFLQVAQARSLSAAAAQLNLAQPALSKAIKSLEDELGAKLLERSARGVALTVAGERLREHCGIILDQLDRARHAVRVAAAKPAGRVAIGMPHSILTVMALPILKAVAREYPDLRVELVQDHSHLLGAQLQSGRIDFAVMASQRSMGGFQATTLLHEEIVFVDFLPDDKVAGKPISFLEASRHPLILPGVGNGLRAAAEAYFRTHSLRLSVVHEVDGIALITRCVAEGLGASLLPRGCVGCDPLGDSLDIRPFLEGGCVRTIVLCKPEEGVVITPAAAEAEKLVRQLAADLVRSGEWSGGQSVEAADQN